MWSFIIRIDDTKKYDEVKTELQAGADPNEKDSENGYPLTIAVKQQNLPMIELLLKNGAYGLSSFDEALETRNKAIVELLIQYDGDGCVNWSYHDGLPLCIAIRLGDLEIVDLLIQNDADVNSIETLWRYREPDIVSRPISEAIKLGDKAIVELLIKNGVNLERYYMYYFVW